MRSSSRSSIRRKARERAGLHALFPVGALVQIDRRTGINSAGDVGVVYEHYHIGGRPGASILFSGGGHDGFAPDDIDVCGVIALTPPQRPHPKASAYRFKNSGSLEHDYSIGVFHDCFAAARHVAGMYLVTRQ